jgi:hypothetical protein
VYPVVTPHKTYEFLVETVKAQNKSLKAITIIDTEIEVDIVPFDGGAEVSATLDERSRESSDQVEEIKPDATSRSAVVEGRVLEGSLRYYRVSWDFLSCLDLLEFRAPPCPMESA